MPPQLPTELLFRIFTYFPLATLLIARGVSQQWRSVLNSAAIHPIRRELMDIYLTCIRESWFLDSRSWTVDNLSTFDRQAYARALLGHYPYLPESFLIWLLEWPAKAAFAWVWPGLPELQEDEMGPFCRDRYGWNMLSSNKPHIWSLQYIDEESVEEGSSPEFLPAIPLFHYPGGYAIWLLLDPREEFRGRVVYTIEEGTLSSALERNEDGKIFPDWIVYLRWEISRLTRSRAFCDKQGKEWGMSKMGIHPFGEKDRIPLVPWTQANTAIV
ncbi:hypothetical protein ONZ45_g7763 [Pleurotus djamor]|nr:hypothetical protein ONZ45_g7763 [Pleurotus djamor]